MLRDYQRLAIEAIRDAAAVGITRQAVVMATGTGKSVVFSYLPGELKIKGQTWLLVHRKELIDQAASHFARANPRASIGVEMADQMADPLNNDIIVASVQSVGSSGEEFNKRISRFNRDSCKLVIPDELHHHTSPINTNVLKYLRVLKGADGEDINRLLVGFTATPGRSDGVGLEAIVDHIVFERGIREMIEEGWLCPLSAYRVETSVDLAGIKTQHGDFAIGELEKRVNTPERNRLIVDKYLELSPEMLPAVAFSVDVRHSHDLALQFRQAGVNALPVSGNTPKSERERLLVAHASREIKILVSCGVYSEGVDIPHAEIGLMCRPTKSHLLLAQQVGRLTRPYPAPEEVAMGRAVIKRAAVIVDFVDNSLKHKLCSVPTLFGLRPDFNAKGESITGVLAEIEAAQEKYKQLRLESFKDLKELQGVLETIDLLKPSGVPSELNGMSSLSWVTGPGQSFQLIGQSFHYSIRQNQLGQYELAQHAAGLRKLMQTFAQGQLRLAVGAADGLVPAAERNLVNSAARWRAGKPTPKQIRLLATLDKNLYAKFGRDMTRFSDFIAGRFSKGDISTMISEKMRNATWTTAKK